MNKTKTITIRFAEDPEKLLKHLLDIRETAGQFKGAQILLDDSEHQGWRNYETFAVAVMIDNTRASYDRWTAHAIARKRGARASKPFTAKERAELDLADELKEFFDKGSPEVPSPWGELMNAGLAAVDWLEIAEHLLGKPAVVEAT